MNMELVPVHLGGALVVICKGCGKTIRQTAKPVAMLERGFLAGFYFSRLFADLDGKAFEDYYCEPCAISKSPSSPTVENR
jgi:hypothetical protein